MAKDLDLKAMAASECSEAPTGIELPETNLAELVQRIFEPDGCEGFKAQALSDPDVVLAPNVVHETAEEVCRAINGDRRSACATRAPVGRLVEMGHIGLINHSGRWEAVPPGRWIIGFHRATWAAFTSLALGEAFQRGPVSMIRVAPGRLGLATDKGQPKLLAPGLHVYNDVTFIFDRCVDVQSDRIDFGPLHVVRVKRGEYVKAWAAGASGALGPKLLREGCYVMNSSLFSTVGSALVSDAHVSHGSLHILQVPKGHVAKVFLENVPRLLGEGTHHLETTNFVYKGIASLTDPVISHGTITVMRVKKGEVGIAWKDNQALFLTEPGLYSFDSPNFEYVRHAPRTEKIIALGTRKLVTVYSGEVGLSYLQGELRILEPGLHEIEDAAHNVDGFLSTQQQSVRLVTVSAEQLRGDGRAGQRSSSGSESDLMICETRDLVKVGVRADVFYAISKPDTAIRRIAKEQIRHLVLETAVATLTNIIRSTTLNDIAQSKNPAVISGHALHEELRTAQAMDKPSAPLFFDKAHDEFLSKLHDDFLSRYGIEITNIRIESFKIMDEELATSISRQAVLTAQVENQLANLAGQTEIATKEQERQASLKQIASQAEAAALRTKTDAENATMLSIAETKAKAEAATAEAKARAEANAMVARAKAEAEAIRLKAQAEAEAIELKAAAEAKRAKMLAETPLGAQLSLLSLYSEMATQSNAGVQKVVYCDLKAGNAGLLGMPSLEALSRDLSGLQKIGADLP